VCPTGLKESQKVLQQVLEMSEELTELEQIILTIIREDSHRASAITRILSKRRVDCDNNAVVQALNSLEGKDLVERYTTKTWIATSKGQSYV
jgi:predicted transcriptional regulator